MTVPTRKVLPILFVTLLIDMIGIGMIIPVLPIIFTDPNSPSFLLSGYSQSGQYLMSGILTALFGLMQFLSAPILGELSDVYGRKRLLTVGVGVLALSQLFFGLGVSIGSLALLFFSRAIAGIAGGNFSIAQASIADVTDAKDRAKNFGLIGAAFGIGFILGPFLGGWLAHFLNAAAPFWVAGIMGALNVICVSLFLPETHQNRKATEHLYLLKGVANIQSAWQDRDARPVYFASFLFASGFTFFTSFVGVLLVSHFSFSEAEIGSYFGFVGIWIVVTQLFILRFLTKLYREREILRVSLLLLALGIGMYPFMPTVLYIYALVPLIAIPNGLSMANLGALVSRGVSRQQQGVALGINSSLMALSQGFVPLLAGVISGMVGIQFAFVSGGVFIFSAWLVLFVIYKVRE